MNKVNLTIDNKIITAEPGTTILAAAMQNDIFIPSFCHINDLKPDPACFICVVEVEGESDLVPSCSTEISAGMCIRTTTERVELARRTCIELLLSDHLGDCLGPCMTACPAMIDIPGFINYLSLGETLRALELINQSMPFPGSLGRICSRPCETACRRQLVETEVAICHLKRFAADAVSESGEEHRPQPAPATDKKVAIVGAGPTGLSAAYFLQLQGHHCTIYDAHKSAGGMLRHCIPDFRLPPDVIEREIGVIKELGTEIKGHTRLGHDVTLEELRDGFDAVFLALGAGKPLSLDVKGEDAAGVISALEFLHEEKHSPHKTRTRTDQKVIIIGGGDVAIDAARVALRKGAADVHIYCLEKHDEMVAGELEIEAARAEGILFHNERGVKDLTIEAGRIKAVKFKRCTTVFDDQGNFNPLFDESDTSTDSCDTLIVAIGQRVDISMAEGVKKNNKGPLQADAHTMQTNLKDVFAGGDCTTGPSTAVEAVAAGRKAATAIGQYITGKKVTGEPIIFHHTMGPLEKVPRQAVEKHQKQDRIGIPGLGPKTRKNNFKEVETGFTAEQAQTEAKRCMACGCRAAHECRLRSYADLFDSAPDRFTGRSREYFLDESHPEIVYAAHKCIQCRTCIRITENLLGDSAMEIAGRGFTARLHPVTDKWLLIDSEELIRIVNHCPVGALTFKNAPVPVSSPVFGRLGVK